MQIVSCLWASHSIVPVRHKWSLMVKWPRIKSEVAKPAAPEWKVPIVLFSEKRTKHLVMCPLLQCNYSPRNEDSHFISLMYERISSLEKLQIFFSLDGCLSYMQIATAKKSADKWPSNTHSKMKEFNRMPFRLETALATSLVSNELSIWYSDETKDRGFHRLYYHFFRYCSWTVGAYKQVASPL